MELNEQRKAGQQSGSAEPGEDEAPARGRKRCPAPQDVAGCLRTDRQNLRTAELELLFKVCLSRFVPVLMLAEDFALRFHALDRLTLRRGIERSMRTKYLLSSRQCVLTVGNDGR